MKITRFILFMLLAIAVNGLLAWLSNLPQDAGPDVPEGKISSVSFAPFREGQSPLTAVYPTTEQIDADLRMLSDETRTIRTYASLGGLKEVPAMARKYGLKMIQGAWIGGMTMAKENRAEVDQLIKAANEYPDVIKRVIVGNEVLLRGELEPEQLLEYIREVKRAVKQPVSYADVWSFYMRYPEIAREVDFITVHILPYWEDEPLTVDQTAAHIEKNYRKIREAYPDKPILIGESGWPSAGRQRGWAIPGVVNEARFIRSLVQAATKNGFDYNIVEAFNQPWKSKQEGVVGANWGLYSADRELVFPLTGKVVENPHWPKRAICAGLILLLAAGFHRNRCLQLSPLRLAGFIGLTQLLGALLVNQFGDLWYTSYSAMERIHALFIAGVSAVFGALVLQRALDFLTGADSGKALGIWMRYLWLAFTAIALYKAQALALNGRYLSIPYAVTCMPVAGLLGLMLIRRFSDGPRLPGVRVIGGLFGNGVLSRCCVRRWSLGLLLTGVILIGVETVAVMFGTNYRTAYPVLADRIHAAFMSTAVYSQLLGWAMLIAAAIFLLPLRASAYALGFMVLALIAGETYAFIVGHDFIDAYPDAGERIGKAFVYTVTNGQMLLWLASLAILALPLWPGEREKA